MNILRMLLIKMKCQKKIAKMKKTIKRRVVKKKETRLKTDLFCSMQLS